MRDVGVTMRKRPFLFAVLALGGCSAKPTVIGLSCIGSLTKITNGQQTKTQGTTHYVIDLNDRTIQKVDDSDIRNDICSAFQTCKVAIDDSTIRATMDGPFALAGPGATIHGKLSINRVSGEFAVVSDVIGTQSSDYYMQTKQGVCSPETPPALPTEHKF